MWVAGAAQMWRAELRERSAPTTAACRPTAARTSTGACACGPPGTRSATCPTRRSGTISSRRPAARLFGRKSLARAARLLLPPGQASAAAQRSGLRRPARDPRRRAPRAAQAHARSRAAPCPAAIPGPRACPTAGTPCAARLRAYWRRTPGRGSTSAAGSSDRRVGEQGSHLRRGARRPAAPLPFPDDALAFAFGEHLIEHLETARERRAARAPPGAAAGRRAAPHDARPEQIIALYEDRNEVIGRAEYMRFLTELTGSPTASGPDLQRLPAPVGASVGLRRGGPAAALVGAGFAAVRRRPAGESDHAALRGLERHGGAEWVNRAEAMCLEATV